jgi:hypothetical protein
LFSIVSLKKYPPLIIQPSLIIPASVTVLEIDSAASVAPGVATMADAHGAMRQAQAAVSAHRIFMA